MSLLLPLAKTLVLVLPAAHGIYVAADSRYDGGDPVQKDRARKIFLCGKRAVCAISGALILNGRTVHPENGAVKQGSLRIDEELEKASAEMPDGRAEEQIEWLGRRLHAPIRKFWDEFLKDRPIPEPMSSWLGAPSVSTILYAGIGEDGGATVVQMQFPFRERRVPEGVLHDLGDPALYPADPARPLAQGSTRCMGIRPDEPPEVETREQTIATLKALFGRTQESGYCASVVGGPTDIAVIDNEGAAWLSRKAGDPPK